MKRYYSILSTLLTLFILSNVIFSTNLFAANASKNNILIEDWSFENSLILKNHPPSLDFSTKITANLKSTPNAFAIRVIGADIGTKNPTCNGANDGKAWVNSITIFAGSPGPFTYTWTLLGATVATGDTARNLGGGSYILRVFDANDNTTFSKGFTITNPIDLAANMFPVDESCFGACDGFAFTNATGGTQFSGGTYRYLWSNAETTSSISNLCVGTYFVTITDSTGCTAVDNITVGGPSVIQPNATVTPVKCKGDNDGTATSNPSGGVPNYIFLWSNAATTATISGLAPGNYTVTVTDNTTCTKTQTVTITEPATLLAGSITVVNPISCGGNTDGILTGNGTGGVPGYTYAWSNSQNSKTIINISAGTYTVTVTDNNGCSKTASTTLTNPSAVTAAITLPATNVSCNGLADGSATVVPGGGIGAPYTFLWSDNQTNATATNLAAGTYSVTVFDGNSCEGVDQVIITEPTTLVASIKNPVKQVSCFGGSDGAAEAEGTGGTLNYSYLWSNATTTALNNGLAQGTYTVTITDNNGCTATAQTTITQPTQVAVTISKTNDITCNGGNQGALLAVGADGTPGYNFSWSNAVNTAANTGLTQGTYTVTITDSKLCTSTDQFVLGEPTVVTAAINTFNNPLCNGQSTGSATVTPGGGTPGYTYLWSNTATTQTINGLSSGTYTVTVNDANSCPATTQITLIDLSTVTAAVNLPATNVSCFGGNNGAATVTPGGGAGGYTYLWSDNQTNQTATGLFAGNYTITVSDANGCTATDQVSISEPTGLIASIKNPVKQISCFGGSDGEAEAVGNGGTLNYSYLWSNATTTAINFGLVPGTYTVTITDANSCAAIAQTTITQPSQVGVTITQTNNVLCNGGNQGALLATGTNGTPGYNYSWSNAVNTASNTGLGIGTYTVTVTDANLCTATNSFIIGEPTAISAAINTFNNPLCSGQSTGAATVTPGGGTPGYTYLWSNTATTQTINGLSSGTYTVTVNDANSCSAITQITLIDLSTVTANMNLPATNVSCFGGNNGAATVTPGGGAGGYSYLWSDNQTTQTANNLLAGTYTVTISDLNGCTASDQVVITEPTLLTVNIPTSSNVSCNGLTNGSATAVPNGGGTGTPTYLWSNAATTATINGLAAGTYTVTISDDNSCTATDQIIITSPPSLSIAISSRVNVLCKGNNTGSLTTTITSPGSPGYTYIWSNGQTSQNATSLIAANYTVTVTDANMCTAIATRSIIEPANALTGVISGTNATCNGFADGSANIVASGGTVAGNYNYLWSNNATSSAITNLLAGTYTVTVTDDNACPFIDQVVVNQNTVITTTTTRTNINCFGDSTGTASVTALPANPNYTYLWSNSKTTANVTTLPAGKFYVTVSDPLGCFAIDSVTITQRDSIRFNITKFDATCNGSTDGIAQVLGVTGGTPGYTYAWKTGSLTGPTFSTFSTILNVPANRYYIIVSDVNGCSSADSVDILPSNPINLLISDTNHVSCNAGADGGAVVIAANGAGGPYTYLWNNNQTSDTLKNVIAGTYTVTVTDISTCTGSISILITEPTAIVTTMAADSVSCNGLADGSATVTTIGGTPNPTPPNYTFLWSNAATTSTITGLTAAQYFVTVTDGNGCTKKDSVDVEEPVILSATIAQTPALCKDSADGSATVNATGGTSSYTYLWSNAGTNQTENGLLAGIYTVTVTDKNGCTTSATATVGEPATSVSSIATITNATCSGKADGSATITASGGTPSAIAPGYTFLWSTTATTQTITGLTAGNYFVTITDGNGCVKLDTARVLDGITIFVSVDSLKMVNCNGGNDGHIEVSGINGTLPYTYAWTNSTSTTGIATNLAANSYTVTITDNNGCFKDTTFIITEPLNALTTVMTSDSVSCFGLADGTATVTASGGTPNYTYLWSNSATTSTLTGLTAAQYFVTVTDDNGCTKKDSIDVEEPLILRATIVQTPALCKDSADGSVTVTATGGTASYTYLWGNAGTNQTENGLIAGNYTVTVTDKNGCTISTTTTVGEPATSISSVVTTTNATCSGKTDGTATVTPSGGTPSAIAPGYTFLWSTTATTQTITGLTAGNYFVTITDGNGCIKLDTANVLDGVTISVSVDSLKMVNCNGGNDGHIEVSGKGGSQPYTYLWNNAVTTNVNANLMAGAYTVTITDDNGCFKDTTINITEPNPIVIAGAIINTSCNGSADGEITATASGGIPPFTYLWSNAQTNATITNLTAGNYTVTVTDDSLCTQSRTFTISPQSGFTFIDSVTNNNCFGDCNGSIEIFNLAGGTAPYTYTWSPIPANGQGNTTATGLCSGSYSLTISDANGCDTNLTYTITEPTIITSITATTDATCSGFADGTATVTPNGGTPRVIAPGYTYLWSNSATTQSITGLSSGQYLVTITDSLGCIKRDTAIVLDGISIFASLDSIKMNKCNGDNSGYIEVSGIGGTGPYTYAWTNTTSTTGIANSLAANSYTVTITDNNGCFKDTTIIITEPAQIIISGTITATSCNGTADGAIAANASGGTPPFTYLWSTAQTNSTITNLTAGSYTVTVTDDSLCTQSRTFNITPQSSFTFIDSVTNNNCFGDCNGSIEIFNLAGGTAPYTYTWSPIPPNGQGNSDATGLCDGTYDLTISDANGCDTSLSYTLVSPTDIVVTTSSTNSDCLVCNGTATASPSGGTSGYTYNWLDASFNPIGQTGITANNLCAGVFNVITRDAFGCLDTASVIVANNNAPVIAATATDVSCFGSTDGTATVTGPCMPGIGCTVVWLNNSGVPIGQTTATATNLAAGVYIVEVTSVTVNGCKAYDTVTVGTPTQIIANPGSTPVSCAATTVCDATAFVAPTGGSSPYTYLWSTTETTDTIKNLCVGAFTVTITDNNNCSITSTINVVLGGSYTVTMTTTPESCGNSCDGTAAVSIPAASFNPPYSYNWIPVPSGQQGNATLNGLCNGVYNVTVTDGSGCTFTASNTVNTQNSIVPNDNFTNVSCGATNDGTATVNPTGGSGTYIYTWTPIPANGQGNNTATGLSVGPIEVLIVDQLNGCDTIVQFNINNSIKITPNETVTMANCNGVCDGSITLAPTGGNGSAYTYTWTPVPPNGQGTPNANGLCAGIYAVIISDNGGCDTTLSITITEPLAIVSGISKLDATCNGTCDGQASVNPTNGVAPYSYLWSNNLTTDTIKNICAGIYTVTITDDNGCAITDQVTITENSAILATTSFTPSTCDVCNGTATVNPIGAGPFTFEWFDNLGAPLGITSLSIINRCAAIYSVEVTDQSTNCKNLFFIPISDFGGETVAMSSTSESCIGACDGTATATFTCSSPVCTVEWFDGATGLTINQTTITATNLCAGNYFAKVTNGFQCVTIEPVTVGSPNALNVTATSTDASCANSCDGTATATATGGTAPYRYVWSPAPGSGQGTANAGGLCVGTYTVQIFDDNGCDLSTTVNIGSPQAVTVSFTSVDPDCGLANGSITVNINGGSSPYTLQWFDGTNTLLVGQTNPLINGLAAGNYTLRVRDNSSCEDFFTFGLSNSNGPTITLDSTTNVSCFGANDGELFITASGGTAPYNFLWTPNGLTFEDISNLNAGSYTVRVTDANGCFSFETYTVTSPQQLMASFATTDAACGVCDGIAEVLMSGGTAPYTYNWSSGATNTKAENLCAGIYVLNVVDAKGCSETFNINVNNAGGPTNEIVRVTDATCRNTCDGTATITPIGGTAPYTFFWPHNSSTANTLNNLCAGSYFVQIMDANNCMRVANVIVDEPDELILNSTITPATCNNFPCDGSILLNVTGGTAPYTYNWGPITLPNSNFVDGLCAGSYTVDILDASGCTQTFTFVVSNTGVTINPAPTATDASCFGSCDGTLAANITSALVDYQWFDANNSAVAAINTDASGLCPGIYTLELTSIPDGCKYYETLEIKEPNRLILTQPVVKNMNCATDCDGQISVNAIGGTLPYTFSWNDPNNQTTSVASNLCVGTYNVVVTDPNGCSATTGASITAPTPISMAVVAKTDVTCSSNCEGTAEISVAGGISPYSVSWSGGQTSTIVTGLCFGPNLVTITDANNCEFIDTVFIAAQDTVVALAGNDTIICNSGTVVLKGATLGTGVTNADWYTYPAFNLFTTSLDTTFERSLGQYQFALIATNGISCNDTTIKTIQIVPSPLIDAGRNVRIFNEEIAQISILGERSTYKYLWVPSTNLNDSTIANPTSDTRKTITYTLFVTDTNGCIGSDSMQVIYQEPITFPTGFTPNGDGNNDVWNLYFIADFPSTTVTIFNRWGENIFESNGYTKPWDGTYKGEDLPSGTYYYIIDLNDSNFEPMTGPITIIR
jgi:gliding motility-associated-like protein